MTTYLDDPDLDALLRSADPAHPDDVRAVAGSPAAAALRTAIADEHPAPRRLRRVLTLGAAVAAALCALLALTIARPSTSDSAYGAGLIRFADNSPRLLVGADGWQVTRVSEEDEHSGEMTFASGTDRLDVFWVAGPHAKDSDKRDFTAFGGTAEIDGTAAWLGYAAEPDGRLDIEALWSVGDQTREARGVFADRDTFLAVAQTLHRVDTDTWLDAMPAWVVTPSARARAVDAMLADIPVPAGFDRSALEDSDQVLDRYGLGAAVTGAVTCAWVDRWTYGDATARHDAAAAMATSRQWAILREMARAGEYPQVVWAVADHMNGADVPTGGLSFRAWARQSLGC